MLGVTACDLLELLMSASNCFCIYAFSFPNYKSVVRPTEFLYHLLKHSRKQKINQQSEWKISVHFSDAPGEERPEEEGGNWGKE